MEHFEAETPVIIPAFNEQDAIPGLLGTLTTLPNGLIDVFVVSNGSTDSTVSVAESFSKRALRSKQPGLDITVLEIPERGLVPATQQAVEYIGKRALNPFLYIYADSVPKHPHAWVNRMIHASEPEGDQPTAVSGPVWFTPRDENDKVSPVMRSIFRTMDGIVTSRIAMKSGENGGHYAPNMAFNMHDNGTLDRFLSFNRDLTGKRRDFSAMGDVAMTREVVNNGQGSFKQINHPDAMVLTPESAAYLPLTHTFRHGVKATNDETLANYKLRAVEDAVDFKYRGADLLKF